MSRSKELAKNTFVIAIGKISTQFISFFLLPLYTAVLSTKEYGTVELFNTCVALLLPVMTLQIEQGVFRFLVEQRKSEEDKTRLISTVLCFMFIQSILCIFLFLILRNLVTVNYEIFILLNMLSNSFSIILLQTARGLGDNLSYSIASFISALVTISCNVLLLIAIHMKADGMLTAVFAGNVCCCIYLIAKLKIYRYMHLSMFNKDLLRELLHYSLPLVPSALSWWVVNASDRIIVSKILGLNATGLLSVANKFPSVYASMYNILNLTWIESATLYMYKEGGNEYFNEMLNTLIKLFTAAFLAIVAVMPFLFPVMVNSNFHDAYYQVPIYMLGSVFNSVVGLISVVYTVGKKTNKIAKTTVMAGIINLIVHLGLIWSIGLYAASISTAVAYGVMAVYRYFDGKKSYEYHISTRFVISAGMVTIVLFITYYMQRLLLSAAAMVIAGVYCIYINRIFIKKVINGVLEWVQVRGKKV